MYPNRNAWTAGAQGTGNELRCTRCEQLGHANARSSLCPRGTRMVKRNLRKGNVGQAPWEMGPQGPQDVKFAQMIEDVKCTKCGIYGHVNANSSECRMNKYYKGPPQPPSAPKFLQPSVSRHLPPLPTNNSRPRYSPYMPPGPAQEAGRAKQSLLTGQRSTNCNIRPTNSVNQEAVICKYMSATRPPDVLISDKPLSKFNYEHHFVK